jgi:methionyl-tRNA synthetase
MNVALQITCNLAILGEPFLPFTSKKLFDLLNINTIKWNGAKQTNNLHAGHKINKDELLFSKIEDSEIETQIQKLQNSKKMNEDSVKPEVKSQKPEIIFDEFEKMDIRIGTVLEAEKIAGTDKLLKLKIDTGMDVRTVVSGIAQYYKPEELIGKQVSILVNLAPRKIKGIESKGMILMAENAKGELSLVSPVKGADNGSTVK